MNKKYHIVSLDRFNAVMLWIKCLTLRTAYEQLEALKARFPEKKFYIEEK